MALTIRQAAGMGSEWAQSLLDEYQRETPVNWVGEGVPEPGLPLAERLGMYRQAPRSIQKRIDACREAGGLAPYDG